MRVALLVMLCLLPCPSCNDVDARGRRGGSPPMPDRLPSQLAVASVPVVPEVLVVDFAIARNEGLVSAGRLQLIDTARQYLGCRYGAGRRGPNRFDCSGFTGYVYEREGITIGRSSRDQYHDGTPVSRRELQPGDLVFFGSGASAARINHVGMVVEQQGDGSFLFIHSSTSQGVIISRSTEPFWSARYVGARRILQ